MKRQIITIIIKTIEAITEAVDPTGANKAVAESLIEVPNKGEEARKIIIRGNTKATVGNLTPPTEVITTIIITVIIKTEVDVAVVVIITETMAAGKAVIKAITIINIVTITGKHLV